MNTPILSIEEFKRRKESLSADPPNDMDQPVADLLAKIRAGRVEGIVFAVDMKDGAPFVFAGGTMTCASALWLAEMLRNKVRPR